MNKTEWLEARRKGISGTDISAILGINPYKTAIDVYLEKKGIVDGPADNEYMEWGRRLESVILNKYLSEHDFLDCPIRINDFLQKGNFCGTPDALLTDRVVEIKTASWRQKEQWGEQGTDQVPEQYLTQVQWYLNLANQDRADVAVLFDGHEYREYTIRRDDNLIGIMTSRAEAFWKNYIEADVPPPATTTKDMAALNAIVKQKESKIIKAPPTIEETGRELAELIAQIKEMENRADAIKERIKQHIGHYEGIQGASFKATWKAPKPSQKTDWRMVAKLANASQELIDSCTQIVENSRRFIFTRLGDQE